MVGLGTFAAHRSVRCIASILCAVSDRFWPFSVTVRPSHLDEGAADELEGHCFDRAVLEDGDFNDV